METSQEPVAVIFDLDGTILNTLPDIKGSVDRLLLEQGLAPATNQEVLSMVGWGIGGLLDRMADHWPQLRFDRAQTIERFAAEFADQAHSKAYVYPAMEWVLQELASIKAQSAGRVRTAILTNKADPAAKALAARLFPPTGSIHFDLVAGARESAPLKPHKGAIEALFQPLGVGTHQVLYVGDSEVDFQAAANSTVAFAGLSWGFRTRDQLEQLGVAPICDSREELLHLIQQHIR